jgi:hypothetical protein
MLLNLIKKYLWFIAFVVGYFIGYERWINPQNHYQIPFAIAIIVFMAIIGKW